MVLNRKIQLFLLLSILVLSTAIVIQWVSTTGPGHQFDFALITESDIREGEQFSKNYCVSCHSYPDPTLLDKNTWLEHTLPSMAPKLGITEHMGRTYPKDTHPHVPEHYYPSDPQLTSDEWHKILAFYYLTAPEKLERKAGMPDIKTDPLFFEAHSPQYATETPSTATVVRFDPGNQLIYSSDIEGTNLLIFNRNLELENSLFLSSTLADVQLIGEPNQSGERGLILTYLGSLYPSDAPEGFIVKTNYNPNPASQGGGSIDTIMENLIRPVETLYTDLNNDGINDLLISEFGHRTGSLFWLEGVGEGQFNKEKNILINQPGCIQSHMVDFTGNELMDIVSLCTQALQQILLFENNGNGEFTKEILLQLPVTFGSSSFELHDFNNNRHLDILYTSGDNADFSITYKPYHGVYIFLNDGNNAYSEDWFYPMNGAYNAKARDFNGNGYLDIAAISFFGDYLNHPEEGFIFFENNALSDSISFTPYHHPETSNGRWITMDVADWTNNGFDDILLANYSMGPDVTPEQAHMDEKFGKGPLFLLLENKNTGLK